MPRLPRLLREVYRRSFWQVLAIYLLGAWFGYEVIQSMTEGLGLPNWFPGLAVVLFIVGLPIVLATALVQRGIPAYSRHDPTLIPDPDDSSAMQRADEARGSAGGLLTWHNAMLAGLAAFALWGVVATGWLILRGSGEPEDASVAVTSSVARVVVLPFTVRGDDEYDYLSEGMVDMLSTKLHVAGELGSVDPRAVLAVVGREEGDAGDPSFGQTIAGELEAGYFVLGNILVIGNRLQLHASLYDASGGLEAIAEGTAEGESDKVFELVDAVAAELLLASGGESGPGVTHIAAVTTNSLDALKEYLQGERALRVGQYQEAVEALRRAVDVDSSFALAWYRLSVAYEWLTRDDLVRYAAEQAYRHSSRLSEHDRLLLEAAVAARRGDVVQAEELYNTIVGSYPGDVEAWFQLGEILFHYGPLMGRPIAVSKEAFERVLSYEPDHVNALIHLTRIEARDHNTASVDSLVELFLVLNQDADRAIELEVLRAFTSGDEGDQARVVDKLRRAPDPVLLTVVGFTPVMTGNYEAGESIALILTEQSRSPEIRALGYIYRGYLAMAQGRWRDAQSEMAEAARFDPTRAAEFGALLMLLPFSPATDGDLVAARATLETIDPDTVRLSVHPSGFLTQHNEVHRLLITYLLGSLNARLADESSADSYATELLSLESPLRGPSLPEDLSLAVRGYTAWRRGEVAEALAFLEQARMQRYYQMAITSPFYSQSFQRYLRAMLLEETGRLDEALRWYSSFAEVSPYDLVHMAPSHLRRAEIHDRRGENDEAARHYARFVELWSDADPELRPLVDRAEARLAELSGEPARR